MEAGKIAVSFGKNIAQRMHTRQAKKIREDMTTEERKLTRLNRKEFCGRGERI